jgi:hypothetical protein
MKHHCMTALASLALLPTFAHAGGAKSHSESVLTTQYFSPPDRLGNIFHKDGFLYVGTDSEFSSKVFDVRDPDNIVIYGAPLLYQNLVKFGNYVMASDRIHDTSNMPSIPYIGSLPHTFPGRYQFVYKDALFTQNRHDDLVMQIFDMTDPLNPVSAGTVPAFDEFIYKDALYTKDAETDTVVQIYDIADPLNSVRTGNTLPVGPLPMTIPGSSLALQILSDSEMVAVLDFTDRLDPQQIDLVMLPDEYDPDSESTRHNGRVYNIAEDGQIHMFKTQPTSPYFTYESTITLDSSIDSFRRFNDRLWIKYTDSSTMDIFFFHPTTGVPTKVSEALTDTYPIAQTNGVAFYEWDLPPSFSSSQEHFEVTAVDTRTPTASPAVWEPANEISGAMLTDDRMYIANELSESIEIYQLNPGASPTLLGTYETTGAPSVLDVIGTTMYSRVQGGTSLLIIDVQTPESPTLINEWEFPMDFAPNGFAFTGHRGYIADQETLHAYDFANPLSPSLLGSLDFPDPVVGLSSIHSNDIGHVVADTSVRGIFLIEANDPTAMTIESTLSYDGIDPYRINLHNEYLYVELFPFIGRGFKWIYDISDPSTPDYLGELDSSGPLDINGNRMLRVFRHDSDRTASMLSMLDNSNPEEPVVLYQFRYEDVKDIQYNGSFAHITQTDNSSILFDFSEDNTQCDSDLNLDDQRTVDDLYLFLDLYHARDPFADFASDGIFNFLDISSYLQSFQESCD